MLQSHRAHASWVSVEYSKFGPSTMASTGHASCTHVRGPTATWQRPCLAEAAVDALGHVNVVAGGAAAAVSARLGLNGDGLDPRD